MWRIQKRHFTNPKVGFGKSPKQIERREDVDVLPALKDGDS